MESAKADTNVVSPSVIEAEETKAVPAFNATLFKDEVIIFTSDQSANRFKIESNINNYYGLYTPAYDGFVETWYDQSGNGNDAVQSTTSKQPKIVDGGSIVTDSNQNPSIQFKRLAGIGGGFLRLKTPIAPMGTTNFAVVDYRRSFAYHLTGADGGNIRVGLYSSGRFRVISGGQSVFSTATFANNSVHLFTADIASSGGTSRVFGDGAEVLSNDFPDANNNFRDIFRGDNDSTGPILITELIIFGTSQLANRPAIEANINNQYSIY